MEHIMHSKVINVGRLCVIQADNGHVWVYDKDAEQMILHINTTVEYTEEILTAFARKMLSETGGLPLAVWALS